MIRIVFPLDLFLGGNKTKLIYFKKRLKLVSIYEFQYSDFLIV